MARRLQAILLPPEVALRHRPRRPDPSARQAWHTCARNQIRRGREPVGSSSARRGLTAAAVRPSRRRRRALLAALAIAAGGGAEIVNERCPARPTVRGRLAGGKAGAGRRAKSVTTRSFSAARSQRSGHAVAEWNRTRFPGSAGSCQRRADNEQGLWASQAFAGVRPAARQPSSSLASSSLQPPHHRQQQQRSRLAVKHRQTICADPFAIPACCHQFKRRRRGKPGISSAAALSTRRSLS